MFSATEMAILVALCADLTPAKFKHDQAKAVIHKCRAIVADASTSESDTATFWVQP